MRRTDSLIEVLLSASELNKYNVTVVQMAQHKPFPSKIIEDLMEKAASEYHMELKRKYLDILRSKEGREIIRREFIDG